MCLIWGRVGNYSRAVDIVLYNACRGISVKYIREMYRSKMIYLYKLYISMRNVIVSGTRKTSIIIEHGCTSRRYTHVTRNNDIIRAHTSPARTPSVKTIRLHRVRIIPKCIIPPKFPRELFSLSLSTWYA